MNLIEKNVVGKKFLVTGGTGFFGKTARKNRTGFCAGGYSRIFEEKR